MPSHRPGALRHLDAASIGAVWIASVALLATPGMAQDKQPRTEVAPFHHGLPCCASSCWRASVKALTPALETL